MNQQIRINIDQSGNRTLENLEFDPLYINGIFIPITSASVVLYKGSNIIGSGTLVISGDYQTGNIFYTGFSPPAYTEVTPPTPSEAKDGLIFDWENVDLTDLVDNPLPNYLAKWTINDEQILNRWFDLVYWKLTNPIDQIDVLNEKPELLSDSRPAKQLECTSNGSTRTLICNRLTEPNDFYIGSEIEFLSGDNNESVILVTGWETVGNTFTFDRNLNHQTKFNDRFILRRGYKPEIESAWNELFSIVNSWVPTGFSSDGLNKIVDSFDLRLPHLYKSMIKICANLSLRKNDSFDNCRILYDGKLSQAMETMRVKIDQNNDGNFDENDEVRGGNLWFTH